MPCAAACAAPSRVEGALGGVEHLADLDQPGRDLLHLGRELGEGLVGQLAVRGQRPELPFEESGLRGRGREGLRVRLEQDPRRDVERASAVSAGMGVSDR